MSKWNQPPKPEAQAQASSPIVERSDEFCKRRERVGEWAAQFTAALLTAGKITPSAVCSTALNYALELERLVSLADLRDL